MTFSELKQQAHDLPLVPGVYIMHDKAGTVIYVGKAKALKNRVSSYFANLSSHTPKTRRMVEQIDWFETIFAKTEFEALLLENTLIKKHMPKYNILLKDDKGYPFVRLSAGEYPRFSVAAQAAQDGARYFGPYGGRGSANAAVDLLQKTFRLPTCSRVFPRDIGKERPCLLYSLGKCCGVCTGEVSRDQYEDLIRQCTLLLEGKDDSLREALELEMNAAAENLEFERAAVCRDRLRAVEKLSLKQIVTGGRASDVDVLAYGVLGSRGAIAMLSFAEGSLIDKKTAFFDGLTEEDASDALESYIKQYYGLLRRAPQALLLSHKLEDHDSIAAFLTSLRGTKCRLEYPQRGDKHKWMEMADQNVRLELEGRAIQEKKSTKTMESIIALLGLETEPQRIEAYDISNTAGAEPVASMTVFVNGKPKKSAYKKFRIKTARGGDDYGAMEEVLGRRLDRAKDGDPGFLPLPDLLLMDGGLGQVRAAQKAMAERGITIPVFGMVKDDHHRTRALVDTDGRELGLRTQPAVFAFFGTIQEETHRFAITYHRQRLEKKNFVSVLDNVPGLGPQRRIKLLERFGSIRAVKAATEEELADVLPKPVAHELYRKLKEK